MERLPDHSIGCVGKEGPYPAAKIAQWQSFFDDKGPHAPHGARTPLGINAWRRFQIEKALEAGGWPAHNINIQHEFSPKI